jgi:hypothetical protein
MAFVLSKKNFSQKPLTGVYHGFFNGTSTAVQQNVKFNIIIAENTTKYKCSVDLRYIYLVPVRLTAERNELIMGAFNK